MFRRKSAQSLRSELASVDELIAAHPLSDPSIRRAHEIIESHGPGDTEAIAAELESLGLPSLDEVGTIQAEQTASWWRLHRRRRKLTRRLGITD
ncbi:hypothetical protein B6G06_04395 [Actinomyces gaoshouyii]|uniref:Uncharacterized protein n=2 Tax=Actinomyces gaoshouyii TaxID=1960083 RepID=A0A8H9LEY1_9ACTO|nr:hypothetical protein B6G06_04395 [Actinomyces gaoshouyii]GGO97895.1 hypothetical protein GCM10011612_11530 [Actinomyces gaoshouyii]